MIYYIVCLKSHTLWGTYEVSTDGGCRWKDIQEIRFLLGGLTTLFAAQQCMNVVNLTRFNNIELKCTQINIPSTEKIRVNIL